MTTKTKKTKKVLKNILPDKVSDLLELAVADSILAEKSGMILNMERWVVPKGVADDWNGPADACTVCMAGAVFVRSCGVPNVRRSHHITTLAKGKMSESDIAKLLLVNELREGESDQSVTYNHPALMLIRQNVDWGSNRAPWYIYLQAAYMLRKDGL